MEYIKELIKKFANSVPEQTKANVNAKYNFEEDNKTLFEAFKNIGCTSFRMTPEEIKEILKKQKNN